MATTKHVLVAAAFAAALASPAAFAVTTLAAEVNGMVCAFCAQGIEKNLRALPATRDVHVDLPGRLVAVELKDGATLDPETIVECCRQSLAEFKRPRLVRIVTDFPKTPIGKIQKNLLREPFWAELKRTI